MMANLETPPGGWRIPFDLRRRPGVSLDQWLLAFGRVVIIAIVDRRIGSVSLS